jgi:hypothetical protein
MPSIPSEVVAPMSATAGRAATKQDRPQVRLVGYQAAARPSLGHAPDHSWLVGRLERDEATDRWYIRYTYPGEQERLGGRLELLGTGSMAGFRVGQTIRAEGKLVDPAPLETQPAYRIRALQALPQ